MLPTRPRVHPATGSELPRSPWPWAVIGGLITSTALSLIVIPAAYTVLHDIGDWFVRKFSRKRAAGDVASAH